MELLKLSKFKLQLQTLITEFRELKVRFSLSLFLSLSLSLSLCIFFLNFLNFVNLSGKRTLSHRATSSSKSGFFFGFNNQFTTNSNVEVCFFFFFNFLGKFGFWCLFGHRSKSKQRKNMAESYRNCKQSQLPPMNSGKSWRERFALNLFDEMPVITNLKLLLLIGFFF